MSEANVISRILSAASKFPDRPAIKVGGVSYSYAEFLAIVKSVKAELERRSIFDEKIIGVLTGNDVHTYASIIAVIASGAAYLPINKKNPSDRNCSIISQAGATVVLASSAHPALENINEMMLDKVKIISTSSLQPMDGEIKVVERTQEDLIYLLFTSGSTGSPKGVPIYNKNLTKFISINLDSGLYDFSEQDRFLQMFELTFDFSVMTLFVPLCVGGCCCVVPDRGISYFNIVDTLKNENITVAPMVPSVLAYLERYFNELNFEALRYSIFCGEPLEYKLTEAWAKCIPNAIIQNAYGPTEATVYCLAYNLSGKSVDDIVKGIVPIGRPYPGMQVIIIDESKHPIHATDVEGELCLSGLQVTDQYWKNEIKTNNSFLRIKEYGNAIFYRTGDRAYLNSNGDYIHCGRTDYQVKIDGHRVELGEIEYIVKEFTGQTQIAAVVTAITNAEQVLRVFLTESQKNEEEIINYLKTKLPPYMIPREVIFLDNIPLNMNGKVDRNVLSSFKNTKN